jgi:hypothetical protein
MYGSLEGAVWEATAFLAALGLSMLITHYRVLKGLLLAAVFSSIMPAQPLVQIQPSSLDLAATGVHLVPLDDIGHTGTVESILAEDRGVLAPVLPYSVLVVNSSLRKLTAVGVAFIWKTPTGPTRKRTLIITQTFNEARGGPKPIAPGASLVFTPDSLTNQYLTLHPANRGDFLRPSRVASSSGARVSIASGTDFPLHLQQTLNTLGIPPNLEAGDFQAYLEGVAFDDNQYVGSDIMLNGLKRDWPELHR